MPALHGQLLPENEIFQEQASMRLQSAGEQAPPFSDPESVLICHFGCRNPYGETAALGRVDPIVFSGSGKTMVVFFSTPISVSVCR
jgi:hypothetical protein